MLTLKPQARAEMVVCIDGPMTEEKPIQAKTFVRGTDCVIDNTVPVLQFIRWIHEWTNGSLKDELGATLFIRCGGGPASVGLAYQYLIESFRPERVQAFNAWSGSGGSNTFVRAGYRITTPDAWIAFHASQHRDTKKVLLADRLKYMGWWADYLEGVDSPELVTRIQRAVFKPNLEDEMEDLPIDLTGADLAAMGKVQLLPDAFMMQGVFNGFLPEAALDPMVRGFWERSERPPSGLTGSLKSKKLSP